MVDAGALAPALPWVVPWLVLPRLAARRPALREEPPASGPPVSVVVPARDEAANIAGVLESLTRSSYPALEIIVVDDRSSDVTAELAWAVARGDPRVRVLEGSEPPAGWYGKPWACLQGYRAARGELILFTDADTRHEPAALGHAVGALLRRQADLVTILTHLECLGFWERVAMPQFLVPLGVRYHPRRVNRARRAKDLIANGQFILVRRSAYERAGTHAAVRGEVAEDLALALAFHRQGLKVHLALAQDLVRTRMYRSLGQLIEGWSKNFYLGGRASLPGAPIRRALLPLAAALYAAFWLAPIVWLAARPGAVAPLAASALAAGFWTAAVSGLKIPPWYGLLYPIGTLVFLAVVVRSTWRGARRVEWRGRRYDQTRWPEG